MSSAVLSPRALSALTLDGKAADGEHCLERLHVECRRRAHERWQTTGEQSEVVNWLEAERTLLRRVPGGVPAGAVVGKGPPAIAVPDAAAGARELPGTVHVQMQELQGRIREREREAEACQATAAAREAEIEKLRSRLATAEAAHAAELERLRAELSAARAAVAARPPPADAATQWPEEAAHAATAARPSAADAATQCPEEAPPRPSQSMDAKTAQELQEATEGLDEEKKKTLESVLERKQVALDRENSSLGFKKPVDFEPRHHGSAPTATFRNEAEALAVLRDAAAMLEVYDTAQVDVEGHTATPDSKLDDWAHELAKNRAERVLAALKGLGIKPERLRAVGKPGKYGVGSTQVLLKITALSRGGA